MFTKELRHLCNYDTLNSRDTLTVLSGFPISEFHCIMPIENVPSVMQRGILSYRQAAKQCPQHVSVADVVVQGRRDEVHRYANLYFHARNPMMYRLKDRAHQLCVLAVDITIALLDGVFFTDRNAASRWRRAFSPDKWRSLLDFETILAHDWLNPDGSVNLVKKSIRCAEILVPDVVPFSYVRLAYVCNAEAQRQLQAVGFSLPVCLKPALFFS